MRVLIVVSFLGAFVLTVMPINYSWRWCRPEFVALLVIYWTLYSPQYFGLRGVWLMGICLDLLEFAPLGFNAIGLLLVSYIVHQVNQRLKNYVLWHQAIWVFILIGIFQLFTNWLGGLFGKSAESPIFLVSAAMGGVLWPLLVIFMERIRLRLRLIH